MTRRTEEIEQDVRALSEEERVRLIRSLLTEFNATADIDPQPTWLETAQRRYRELIEGKVDGVPGPLVFERLRANLSLDESDSSLEAAWLKEAEDRLAAYRAGDLEPLDADQVFRELGKRT
jgi:hypothetical protein